MSTIKIPVELQADSKDKICDGLIRRCAEFRYDYLYTYETRSDANPRNIEIITVVDHEITLLWTLECEIKSDGAFYICVWKNIKLQGFAKTISANFQIQENFKGRNNLVKGSFDLNFSTLEQNLPLEIWSRDHPTKLIIEIYRNDYELTSVIKDDEVSSLIEDYTKFLENKELCDVTFVIGDEEILAHKQIISARSDVFASMFTSDMLEKKPVVLRLLISNQQFSSYC